MTQVFAIADNLARQGIYKISRLIPIASIIYNNNIIIIDVKFSKLINCIFNKIMIIETNYNNWSIHFLKLKIL